ncbi:hypothetical protein F4778DRAFT_763259 [Xylariomycetidae sp. FL2044]|nr:hypothetical protein F4778DRAFT_763259 [Xylariomycetidae sp. FL2044]
MGKEKDEEEEGGVVDDELRVHGFANVKIADASVLPKISAAHTMASGIHGGGALRWFCEERLGG